MGREPFQPQARASERNYGLVILAPHGKVVAGAVIQADDPRLAALTSILSQIAAINSATTVPAHATKHMAGGSDAIRLDQLAAPANNTTLDATTTLHGLLSAADKQKLDGLHAGGVLSITLAVPSNMTGKDGDGAFVLSDLGIYYKESGVWTLFGHVAKKVENHQVTFKTPTAGDGTAELATTP